MTSRNPLKRRLSQLSDAQHIATERSGSGTSTTSRDARQSSSNPHDTGGYGDEVLETYFMRSITNETQYNGQLDSSLACFTIGRPSLQISQEDLVQETANDEQAAPLKDHIRAEPICKTGGPSTTIPFPRRCLPSASTGNTPSSGRRVPQDHVAIVPRTTRSDLGVDARTLDCMPWEGKGPEDRMTEKVIREGYFEKPPVSNELNTARPSFWAQLKGGVGLTCLSALYTDVLSQKQQLGRVDGLSMFKPPPRVTLTDTKRETWLRDLANASLPLKRLSRTIPHGLRGRVLLEQCLTKTIPIERAVWLAKCVGANELRAFRRKGVTGAASAVNEENWSLEWTLAVEAFSLDCINSLEEQGRKERITYAFEISASLFTSNLLVKDHFLFWLLIQLEQCGLHAFMIWFTFASSYHKPILQDISQGRHLVRALVSRIAEIDRLPQRPAALTMLRRAQGLLCNLCLSTPWCVVFPEQHDLYERVLGALSSNLGQDKAVRRIHQLIHRNKRLAVATGSLRTSGRPLPPTLATHLDNTVPQGIKNLSSHCLKLAKNAKEAVLELLIWSSTIHRIGSERIYVAMQILTAWSHGGVDITDCILSGLPYLDQVPHLRSRKVGRIVAELSCQGFFDLSTALRRFIVTGSIRRNPSAGEISCTHSILLDMPRHMLTPTLNNIRSMLLRNAGISSDTGVDALKHLSELYDSRLQRILANDSDVCKLDEAVDLSPLLAQASWGGVLELTAYLTQRYGELSVTVSDRSIRSRSAICLLKILDDLGEHHTLLQFALKVLALEDMDDIASIACIARIRLPTILALPDGQALPLRILDTYCICRAISPPSRVIVQALSEIFTHLQIQGRIQEYLKHEIVLWDQTFAVMACSPLSDLQTDGTQPSASLLDDLEGVVSQAQVMELDTVERIFAILSARLLELEGSSCLDKITLRVLFQRIRVCNGSKLVQPWLVDQLGKSKDQFSTRAVSLLISCGGIPTEVFTAASAEAYEAAVRAGATFAAQVATRILGVMVDAVTDSVLLESKFPEPLFPAIKFGHYVHRVLACYAALCTTDGTELPAILSTPSFSSALGSMLSTDAINVESGLDLDCLLKTESAFVVLRSLTIALLYPSPNGSQEHSQTDNTRGAASQDGELLHKIFMTVDELCLPTYRLALKILVHLDHNFRLVNDEDRLQGCITNTVTLAMQNTGRCWLRLLPVLSNDMLSEIAHSTEDNLLSQDNTAERSIQLDVLRITAQHLSEESSLQMCKTITERLAAVIHDDERRPTSTEHVRTLIELALVHSGTLLTSTEAQSVRVEILLILPQILTLQHLSLSTATLEFVFDTAAYLVTDLTAATKDHIQSHLGLLADHPRIKFLFGFRDRPNGWLYATTETSFTLQDGEPTSSELRSHLQPFRTQPWEMLAHSTPNSGVNNAALSLHLFDARQV